LHDHAGHLLIAFSLLATPFFRYKPDHPNWHGCCKKPNSVVDSQPEEASMRTFISIVFLLFVAPGISQAAQYARGSQVVHTRLAPVVAHRVVPPYRGIHVYEGRVLRR